MNEWEGFQSTDLIDERDEYEGGVNSEEPSSPSMDPEHKAEARVLWIKLKPLGSVSELFFLSPGLLESLSAHGPSPYFPSLQMN